MARKSARKYLPTNAQLPHYHLPKVRERATNPKTFLSRSHKTKAFADDLTIISSSIHSHQAVLDITTQRCMEIDLQIRPDKCTSILFDGKKLLTNSSMPLPCGKTRDIRSAPTKFLGGFIAHNRKTARLAASDHLSTTITSALRKLEKSPIRGEYKIWVLKHYVGPSVNFFLAIDDIPKCTLKSIQGKITKHIKKWLNLPRSTTQAVLYTPSSYP